MDDSPRAIAERLTGYVDELLAARETCCCRAVARASTDWRWSRATGAFIGYGHDEFPLTFSRLVASAFAAERLTATPQTHPR